MVAQVCAFAGTVTVMPRHPNRSYSDALFEELDQIESSIVAVVEASQIVNIDPNRGTSGGVMFLGYATHGWAPSEAPLEASRMAALGQLRDWSPRFELLFPHPTPQVKERHDRQLALLERWLTRPAGDKTVPYSLSAAVNDARQAVAILRKARTLLGADDFPERLVVDTNALVDDPDLAVYTARLGRRYLVHVLPVVLRELDELKRAGRNPELREAAKKADRRLKGYRDNGDVRAGAKVAGDVWVVFEHVEPKATGLPSWLDLDVPDDRFVASALLLQSQHSGSTLTVATSDLNLQTKLAAVALPYIEPPDPD